MFDDENQNENENRLERNNEWNKDVIRQTKDMTKKQTIQLFEEKKVRTVWDDEQEKCFFCVADVVEVLTESKAPKDYIKKMKQRDPELSKGWGQIGTPPFLGVSEVS